MGATMFETRTERKTVIVFTDDDYRLAGDLLRLAMENTHAALRTNRGHGAETCLMLNAACKAVETICAYGIAEVDDDADAGETA
jgi:hypothetical protein